VKLNFPPAGILPESNTPEVSDVDVCAMVSLFVHVTIVPLEMVIGLGASALEPRVLAPERTGRENQHVIQRRRYGGRKRLPSEKLR